MVACEYVDPARKFVSDATKDDLPLLLGASDLRRIVNAPMDTACAAWKYGADLFSVVADGDHVANCPGPTRMRPRTDETTRW